MTAEVGHQEKRRARPAAKFLAVSHFCDDFAYAIGAQVVQDRRSTTGHQIAVFAPSGRPMTRLLLSARLVFAKRP